jgi:16S rRNA (guanine527-N7)-methyltransferase
VTDIPTRLGARAAAALGRPLTATAVAVLYKYLNLLIKWNRTQRLIGSSDPAWIVDNVIADSLLFCRALPPTVLTLCDVGSGAGIPGVPLKIVLPLVDVVLLEARQRRASFLSTCVRELGLTRCRVINGRLADVRAQLAHQFDAVVMRCAGDPVTLLSDAKHLLAPGGLIVASGPPTPRPVQIGEWIEVVGDLGPRRFWRYHNT